jgi:hypothetical protein
MKTYGKTVIFSIVGTVLGVGCLFGFYCKAKENSANSQSINPQKSSYNGNSPLTKPAAPKTYSKPAPKKVSTITRIKQFNIVIDVDFA